MFLRILTVAASLFTSTMACAETPVPNDHSTVQILFVVPYETPDMGGIGGAPQTKAVPRAVVGDLVLPIDSIHPISIAIDGEFVGHSMHGSHSIKPIFVLPSGLHKFEFKCDVFKTTNADLKVIGTGSKQYLIIKMVPKTVDDKGQTATEAKAPTTPPKG